MKQPPAGVLLGIGCAVTACACFSMLDSAAKAVAASVAPLMALWVRYVVQSLLTTAVLLPRQGRGLLRTRHPLLQLLRGALLVLSTTLAFLSLRSMAVGEFTAIVMVTPLLVTLLAVTVLREHVARLHWVFVVGGFLGTLLIVRPGGAQFGMPALYALGCMASNSVFQLLTGHLSRRDNPATTHFYTGWVGALLATLVLPWTWTAVDSPWLWTLMLLMGMLAAIGHFLLAIAYQHAPIAMLMPYLYSHVCFAVLAGWVFFSHVPDAWSFAGIALIALSGLGGAWLTGRRLRAPVPAPPPAG